MTPRQLRLLKTVGIASTAWMLYHHRNGVKNLTTTFYHIKLRAQQVSNFQELNEASQDLITLEQYLKFWREIPVSNLQELVKTPEQVMLVAAQIDKFVDFFKVVRHVKYTNRVEEEILERILLAYLLKQKPQLEQLTQIFTLANLVSDRDAGCSFQSRVMGAYLSLVWEYPFLELFTDIKSITSFVARQDLHADSKKLFLANQDVIKFSLFKIANIAELKSLLQIYDPAIKHEIILGLLNPEWRHAVRIIKDADLKIGPLTELLESVVIADDKLGDAQKDLLIAFGDHAYIDLILANRAHFNKILRPASIHYLNRLASGEKPVTIVQPVLWVDKSRPLVVRMVQAMCAARPPFPYSRVNERLSYQTYRQTEFDQLLASLSQFKTMEEFATYLHKISKHDLQKHLTSPARCAELLYRIDYIFNRWYDDSFVESYRFVVPKFKREFSPINTRYYNILNEYYADQKRDKIIDMVLDVYIQKYLRSPKDIEALLDLLGVSIYQPSYTAFITGLPELDLYQDGIQAIVSRKLCHNNPARLFTQKKELPQEVTSLSHKLD